MNQPPLGGSATAEVIEDDPEKGYVVVEGIAQYWEDQYIQAPYRYLFVEESGRPEDPPRPLTSEPLLSNKQRLLISRSQRAGLSLLVFDSLGASWMKNITLPAWTASSCSDADEAEAECLLSTALSALTDYQAALEQGDLDTADQLLFIALDILNYMPAPNIEQTRTRNIVRTPEQQARDEILQEILAQPAPTTSSAANFITQLVLAVTEDPTELSATAQQQILTYLPSLLPLALAPTLQVVQYTTVNACYFIIVILVSSLSCHAKTHPQPCRLLGKLSAT